MADYTKAIEITKQFNKKLSETIHKYNELMKELYPNYVFTIEKDLDPQFNVEDFSFDKPYVDWIGDFNFHNESGEMYRIHYISKDVDGIRVVECKPEKSVVIEVY